jgi:hypothetical protein
MILPVGGNAEGLVYVALQSLSVMNRVVTGVFHDVTGPLRSPHHAYSLEALVTRERCLGLGMKAGYEN